MEIQEYRGQLYEYLKNRMFAIAPNLTAVVGKLKQKLFFAFFINPVWLAPIWIKLKIS